MILRSVSALAIAMAIAACGGKNNEVNGSYRGQSIDVSDGALLPPIKDTAGSSISVIVLESESDTCSLLQARALNNTRAVSIVLGIQTADGTLSLPTVAGTYDIVGPLFRKVGSKVAAVNFAVFGSCGPGTTGDATSGTVHLTHVATKADGTPSEIDGTFNATFDTGEVLTGAFRVAACSGARLIVGVCR